METWLGIENKKWKTEDDLDEITQNLQEQSTSSHTFKNIKNVYPALHTSQKAVPRPLINLNDLILESEVKGGAQVG